MSHSTHAETGLEAILELLEMRFEYDDRGRIVGCKHEGVMPRFVLGRSAEGCVWRFAACIGSDVVQRVAKLAGRGSGFPIGLPPPHPPPERLATIEGILDSTVDREQIRAGKGPSREFLTRGEFTIGEIWSLE